jgi:hypothetical protein
MSMMFMSIYPARNRHLSVLSRIDHRKHPARNRHFYRPTLIFNHDMVVFALIFDHGVVVFQKAAAIFR